MKKKESITKKEERSHGGDFFQKSLSENVFSKDNIFGGIRHYNGNRKTCQVLHCFLKENLHSSTFYAIYNRD